MRGFGGEAAPAQRRTPAEKAGLVQEEPAPAVLRGGSELRDAHRFRISIFRLPGGV